MSRTLETRLAKLEAAQGPAVAAAHILFAQTASVADAMIAERIAQGMAKEADHFIVIQWVAAEDGRPVPCRSTTSRHGFDGEAQARGSMKRFWHGERGRDGLMEIARCLFVRLRCTDRNKQ